MMHQNLSLRQRLPKKTLGEVSTNTTSNAEALHSEYRRISPEYWSRTYRKDFPKFRVFLDKLEDKYSKPLERKIKLLGAKCEVFFGQQCTHVVTMKPFYDELPPRESVDAVPTTTSKQQDQENIPVKPTTSSSTNEMKANFPKKPNVAKDPSQQLFFDRAHGLGIEVWSVSKMNYVVSALMNKPSTHGPPIHRGTRLENLDKLLLEEKRYGVSTGHRNGQAPRPTYVTFNEHYIKVEDVAGVHCPILVKEFHTPTFDPDIPEIDRVYPWPKLYVKKDAHVRSPFAIPDSHQKSKKPANPAASMQSSKKHTPLQIQQQQQQPQQQQIPVQTHSTIAMPPPATATPNNNTAYPCIPSNTFAHHDNNNNNNQSQQDQHLQSVQQHQQNNHYQDMDQENHLTPAPSLDPVGPASADISQMTSKTANTIYPSTAQSQFTQTSKSTNAHTPTQVPSNTSEKNATFRRSAAPLYENMYRMDRRMVSNQRTDAARSEMTAGAINMNGGADLKSQSKKLLGSTTVGGSQMTGLRPAVAAKTAHDQAERRKKDLARRLAKENSKYCENCVTYYQDLDKHLQDESHQAFVRDKNNFKELDLVLESTRRLRRQV